MGFHYLFFRGSHLISIKSGLFKKKFPTDPPLVDAISLNEWKNNLPSFFFYGKNIKGLQKQKPDCLEDMFNDLSGGTYTFF